MTREEAIKILQALQIPQCGDREITEDEKYTAFDMAIKALEQEPTRIDRLERRIDENTVVFRALDGEEVEYVRKEPCGYAVRREAVCEIISDIRDCISVEGYCAIIERLKKLPPVTQKSGKWMVMTSREMYCSECNEVEELNTHKNFCPWCGADMRGE